MENREENCEMIWKVWKKGKSNSEKNVKNLEEKSVEQGKDMDNMEER